MTSTRTIGFIGGGNMAEAMIRGLLRGKDFAPGQVSVSGPRAERMRELHETYGIEQIETLTPPQQRRTSKSSPPASKESRRCRRPGP